jgi:hypothetical protein
MCLEISINNGVNTKRVNKLIKTVNKNGLIAGYKHFRRSLSRGTIRSSYFSEYQWHAGLVDSGRSKGIYVHEYNYREINHGFHIFLNKKDALWDMHDVIGRNINSDHKLFVRKVWFKPEDLVAVGKFYRTPSAVVTKLYVRFD